MKKLTILLLINLFTITLLAKSTSTEDLVIDLNPPIIKKNYEAMDKYQEPEELPSKTQKKENSSINVDVDVNKEQKQIDSLKLDVGKKF